MNLKDSAVRLYHKKERDQIDKFFNAVQQLNNTGSFDNFENTNADKVWTWGCKRWKDFPYREFELRDN